MKQLEKMKNRMTLKKKLSGLKKLLNAQGL
jgi:hypothetical protein